MLAVKSAEVADIVSAAASSKVVALHQFGHEEQIKNSDTGTQNATGRARKSMLPASDQAKVPSSSGNALSTLQEELLEQIQHNQEMSEEEKKATAAKVKRAIADIKKDTQNLIKTFQDSAQKAGAGNPTPATPKAGAGDPTPPSSGYDSWNQNILLLFQAFAVNQMNQNNLIMGGWVSQQQAQNTTLQDAAAGEQELANKSTSSKTASWWKIALIGVGVAVGVLVLGCLTFGVGAAMGTAAAAASAAAEMGITAGVAEGVTATAVGSAALGAVGTYSIGGAALAGAATGLACWGAASANPNSSANAGITESGLSESVLTDIQNENTFWSMVSQKANNNISTGSQLDVVNPSSSNTTIGQEASQAIQAMGQTMQTPVAH
jgi:hypothetical protein